MLKESLDDLSTRYEPLSILRQRIEQMLSSASSEELRQFMFDPAAESARQFIDSFLNEYDGRHRQQVLKDLARSVPQELADFFVHAFSRRTPEDEPFP